MIEYNKCEKQEYNSHMGTMCYNSKGVIFFFDTAEWVKVGDEVKCERDDKGFYRRIWVNGVLKTSNYQND